MDRIIVWGITRRTAMYYTWLDEMYDIVAFVTDNAICRKYNGIDVITKAEVTQYDFDKIIITTEEDEVDEALDCIRAINENYCDISFSLNLVSNGSNTIEGYFDYVARHQLEVIDEILNATDEEITDFNWMLAKVKQYGIFCFQKDWMKMTDDIRWAVCGLQQIPEEFASFCCFISQYTVKKAIEVGVYRGRSAIFLCAVFARKNPDLIYEMVDICDRIDDFEKFKEVLPQLQKCIPSSSQDYCEEEYDFVFIDADHSYDASILDFNNIGNYAKIITAFHDIYAHEYDHENGGTVRMWQEVLSRTKGCDHEVFSIYPDKWMGIGAVIWNR